MTLISASRLELAVDCTAWVDMSYEDLPGKAAVFGSAFHACAALGRGATLDAVAAQLSRFDLSKVDQGRLVRMWAGWRHRWPDYEPPNARYEVAFAYDPIDGQVHELGSDIDRQYEEHGAKPHHLVGSVDVLGVEGPLGYVIDHKTGRRTTESQDNLQLAFAAYCLHKIAGVDEVHVALHYIDETGRITTDESLLVDFNHIEQTLQEIHARRLHKEAPRPGPHCKAKWCPARDTCPARVEKLEDKGAQVIPLTGLAQVTRVTAPQVYAAVRAAEERIAQVKAELKKIADEGPIPLQNGMVYRAVQQAGRETVDKKMLASEWPEVASRVIKKGKPFTTYRECKE